MNHIKTILGALLLFSLGITIIQAQETVPATGGDATGSGGSVSYTVGQVAYITLTGSGGTITPGAQQPYEIGGTKTPAPIAADQEVCQGNTIPELTATGENINWYSDAGLLTLEHSGTPFSTGETDQGVYTYYVTQTINGDESPATEAVLTIHGNPTATITDSTNVSCNGLDNGTAIVTPAGGTAPYTYNWDDDLNTSDSTVSGLSGNTYYHVIVTDDNSCSVMDSVILDIPESIILEMQYPEKICPGSADADISLIITGGTPPYSFNWSTGEDTSTINNLSPGKYKVTVTDAQGCIAQDSARIDSITTYQNSEICLVTVNNSNRILVVWEKAYNQGIAYYNIYREQFSKDNYVKIATIPFESLSVFVDESSVPEENPHFYKISASDSCGNESVLSPLHKSIHLTANLGLNNEVNLNWDEYEGFDYFEYEIYRGNSLTELYSIRTISASIRSWSDKSAPSGKNFYRILVVKPEPCFPTDYKSDEYSSPFSNFDEKTLVGNYDFEANNFIIYPNPFSHSTTIHFPNSAQEPYRMVLTDLSGKVIRIVDDITTSEYVLKKGDLKNGLYFIELRGPKIYRGKIVIE